MTIARLRLQRFTPFETLDFKPSRGINVLVGANGTGKMHLMKAAYAGCVVFNIRTWNQRLGGFPLSRVPT